MNIHQINTSQYYCATAWLRILIEIEKYLIKLRKVPVKNSLVKLRTFEKKIYLELIKIKPWLTDSKCLQMKDYLYTELMLVSKRCKTVLAVKP